MGPAPRCKVEEKLLLVRLSMWRVVKTAKPGAAAATASCQAVNLSLLTSVSRSLIYPINAERSVQKVIFYPLINNNMAPTSPCVLLRRE